MTKQNDIAPAPETAADVAPVRTRPLRVIQYGLGPIGLECARAVLRKQATGLIELVGAIDIDPEKQGRDLAALLSLDASTGITVSGDAAAVLDATRPDVVLHTTSSYLERMYDQILGCIEAGAHVVSSTEELFFPHALHPHIATRLDAAARARGVVVVGTGVNPGFAMDTLALMATAVCCDVESLRVTRVVDAGKRRLSLQRKIGAGLTREAFVEKQRAGSFGHVGLHESLLFVARGLGWQLERAEEQLLPVLAERDAYNPYFRVEAGTVAGLHHAIVGYIGGRAVLSLDLKMFVGADEPYDAVNVQGSPNVDLVVRGGIFGDTATVAMLINTAPLLLTAPPGLRTVADLPLPRAFATSLVQSAGRAA